MDFEIEEEYQMFLHDYNNGALIFGKYMDETDYEDEYSHNDINNSQGRLIRKIKEFLHESASGKYIVTSGYCVIVMTPDRARELGISERTIKNRLVI